MPGATVTITPGLASFLKSLKGRDGRDVESSTELLISLLKRRQIKSSRPCAIATAELLRRVVAESKGRNAQDLIDRIKSVGSRLVAAQPREMVVGNIVRRVLGLIRECVEIQEEGEESASEAGMAHSQELPSRPKLPSHISAFSPLKHAGIQPPDLSIAPDSGTATPRSDVSNSRRPQLFSSHTSYAPAGAPTVTSLFGLFNQQGADSATSTPPNFANSPAAKPVSFADKIFKVDQQPQHENIKVDVIEGIKEILDELDVVDEQISAYALENIHSDEIILTHTSSLTIQRFLVTAAKKRKFTVIHVEGYPNDSVATHDTILNGAKKDVTADEDDEGELERFKPLTEAGIKVIMIPDSAVFAIMSRVNKVILATHSVLANGGLVAASGAKMIAQAARAHQTPVVVLSGIYKLSPIYPFDVDDLIEFGDAGTAASYEDAEFVDKIDVVNPVYDYVEPGLVDLYISNLGGHAPSYLYHVVAEHYNPADIQL